MRTGIALFVYNRPEHTKRVLEGLKKNSIKKLYIFADGLKEEKHRQNFEKLRDLIDSVDWCETEIIKQNQNKGLANSIIYGVNYILERYERVIVLEDDCIPAPNFVEFMEKCFDRYESNEKIMSVSGYSYPINIPKEYKYDVYFSYRGCSWGWGTWKRAWKKFNRDYDVLKRIYEFEESKRRLELAGNDLIDMLKLQLEGKVDSWAVFWALNIIENNSVSIMPIKSLIINDGFDGTGTNCEITNKYNTKSNYVDISKLNFPRNIVHDEKIDENLKKLWSCIRNEDILKEYYDICNKWIKNLQNQIFISRYFINENVKQVYIYGSGKVGKTLCDELINGGITVLKFIDAKICNEEYKGIPVIDICELIEDNPKAVVIVTPVWDFQNINENLRKNGFNGIIVSLKSIIDTLSCKR